MDGWLDELRMVEEVDGWRMASWTDSWMNEITCMNLIDLRNTLTFLFITAILF